MAKLTDYTRGLEKSLLLAATVATSVTAGNAAASELGTQFNTSHAAFQKTAQGSTRAGTLAALGEELEQVVGARVESIDFGNGYKFQRPVKGPSHSGPKSEYKA